MLCGEELKEKPKTCVNSVGTVAVLGELWLLLEEKPKKCVFLLGLLLFGSYAFVLSHSPVFFDAEMVEILHRVHRRCPPVRSLL